MPLNGFYLLRIVSVDHPDPGPGGMFLTLTANGEVKVEAMGPDTFEAQKWFVQAVEGGTNVYTIGKPFPGPPKGLREGWLGENTDEVRVVFGVGPEEWRILNVSDSSDVYIISPNKNFPIGVEHLVGTDNTEVVVKTFPVIPGDRPAWKFEAIEG